MLISYIETITNKLAGNGLPLIILDQDFYTCTYIFNNNNNKKYVNQNQNIMTAVIYNQAIIPKIIFCLFNIINHNPCTYQPT